MDDKSPRSRFEDVSEPHHVPAYAPQVEALATELLGYVADKWTMIVLEELAEHGTLRFGALRRAIPGISQKMLTQTLRQLESVGLVERTVHPVIPPRVEYARTALGLSLGPVLCQLWSWVEDHAQEMEAARQRYRATA